MTLPEANEVLRRDFEGKGPSPYISFEGEKAILDGEFTADLAEAVAVRLRANQEAQAMIG